MYDHIQYLIALLEKETATFRLLLASLEAEQQALVHHDTAALGEAVETQKALSRRASLQERDRVKLVRQIAALVHEDPKTLTLKRLIELVDAPLAERLGTQREALLDVQNTLRKVNRQNSVLLKQSMKYVDKSLQILTGGGKSGHLYERSGKADRPTKGAPALRGVVNQVV